MSRRYGILTFAIVLVLALLTIGMIDCWSIERDRAETAEALLRGSIATATEREAMLQASESQVASLTADVSTLTAEVQRLTSDNASLVVQVQELTPQRTASTPAYQGGDIPDLIRSVAAGCGLSASDGALLVELARRESTLGQNPEAYRQGRTCVGLFQLDGEKGTYEQRIDNEWNANRAITYIQDRYVTVAAAIAHHDQKGWY